MKWSKLGIVYTSPNDASWRDNSALTPTAVQIHDKEIRVYAGFRDQDGVSRIGYVDVDAENPTIIKRISTRPVLNTGDPGMFDDNGVILGDIIKVGNQWRMYYVGFQLVNSVKFLAYSGLSISSDNGETFQRYSSTPILDRRDEGQYIRAIHSVVPDSDGFHVWYAVGNGWETIANKKYPQYDINYMFSQDGINFPEKGTKVLTCNTSNLEYRIGRPRVIKRQSKFIMNFTYGTTDGRYQAGQAESKDGKVWERGDDELGISVSSSGWDSKHLSYPSVIKTKSGLEFMFYNGNNMGQNGFGAAILSEVVNVD